MASKHTYRTSLEFYLGGSELVDIEATVKFTFTAGSTDLFDKGHGAWLPGDSDEIEIVDIVLSWRKGASDATPPDCPMWLFDIIADKIDHDSLREVVAGDHAEAMDARDEARAEARAS
jgi:hypothetical protein